METSDIAGDSKKLFGGMSILAPKPRAQTVALKNSDGSHCLSIEEEDEVRVCRTFEAKFTGGEPPESLEYEDLAKDTTSTWKRPYELILGKPHVRIYVDEPRMLHIGRTKAGWGFLAVLFAEGVEMLLHKGCGPFVLDPRHPLLLGGESGSNNGAECSAQCRAHRWALLAPWATISVVL